MSHGNDHQPITVMGEANYRNRLRRFGIKQDDRRRHMYVIGKTGMGKSVLLENLAISDIHMDHGLCFIDPHGDAAEDILEYVPPHRINDVVYFNPADLDFPIAFNIFETVDHRYKHLVASGLVAVFKKMWADSWGPRLEYILRNAILALLDFPSSTLLGVPRMLVDKQYRKKVVAKITDPVVKSFWVGEFENYNEKFMTEAISPIQNKVGQFLSSSVVRNILGQVKSTIDLNDIMDNGKILILNLSKGKLGEDNSALIGAMMITKIQLAAMQRAAIPEEQRRDFYLYVDEFQNFATEAFATVLSEARKYRLNLTIANQYVEQMQEEVAAAVFGNVGTMVCFRIGAQDGEIFEKEFEPVFMAHDLVNLPKYNMYLKLMVDGIATPGFSAQTLPIMYERYAQSQKVVAVSRERYARPRMEVEEMIMRWSGVQVIPANAQVSDVIANQAATAQLPDALSPVRQEVVGQSPFQHASSPEAPSSHEMNPEASAPMHRGPSYQGPRAKMPGLNIAEPMYPQQSTEQQMPTQEYSSPTPMDLVDPTEPSFEHLEVPHELQEQEMQPMPTQEHVLEQSQQQDYAQPVQNFYANQADATLQPEAMEPAAFEPVQAPTSSHEPSSTSVMPSNQPPATTQIKVILPEELEKQMKAQNKKKKKGKKPVDPNRKMYQTVCNECGVPIEVPFVPDGSRPVLCQDCLPEYRSRMARMEAQAREERGESEPQQQAPQKSPQPKQPQPKRGDSGRQPRQRQDRPSGQQNPPRRPEPRKPRQENRPQENKPQQPVEQSKAPEQKPATKPRIGQSVHF